MAFLFWLFWGIGLLLCAIAIIGKGFGDSFHERDNVPWLPILLVGCTVGSFVLRVFLKKPAWSLGLAALPLLVLLIMYLIDKSKGS